MSKLLFDEQPLIVSRELAKLIGLNEAIVLQQVHYWLEINRKANKNFHDGQYWTYNSIKNWHENDFSFWSFDTVKRTFTSLVKKGFLIAGNYNKQKFDQTKWYSIDYKALESLNLPISAKCPNGIGQNAPTISAKCPNGLMQNAPMDNGILPQPIPENNLVPESTKEKSTESTCGESMSMSMSTSDSTPELSTGTKKRIDRTQTIDNDMRQTEIFEIKKGPSSIPYAHQSKELNESPFVNIASFTKDFNTIEKVIQENISYNYFRQDIELVNDFVACMVNTMLTDDSVKITISNGKNKETKPISVVKSVLMRIKHEHIQHAIDQYKAQHHKITYKIPYMRNMLYNTYLELNAHYTNQVRADGVVW